MIFTFIKSKIVAVVVFVVAVMGIYIQELRRQREQVKADLAQGEADQLRNTRKAQKKARLKGREIIALAKERARKAVSTGVRRDID